MSELKKELILTSARTCLEETGLAFKVSDLAKQAEVSVGTIYNYFKSKEEILAVLLDREFTEVGTPNDLDHMINAIQKYIPPEIHAVLKARTGR